MSKFTIEDNQIIEENEKWFKFFVVFPKVVTIVLAIIFFIMGIAFEAEFGEGWIWIATWFAGAITCALTYILLKLSLSYKILHIYYLKQLTNKQPAATKTEPQVNNNLPEI